MIYEIKGKMTVNWNGDVKAIVDTWNDYSVPLEDFSEAVLVKGLDHARANGGVAWIVDSSNATGVFSQEIQAFIASTVFSTLATNGIKYFITITSTRSAITRLTVSSYTAKLGPSGIQLLEVNSVDEAIEWLKLQN